MSEYFRYFLIGFLQGFTEVLPVSSSAHLIILSNILNINMTLEFEIFLHIGSLIAVIIYLRKKLNKLIKEFFIFVIKKNNLYKESFLYVIYLIISTLIVFFGTLLFKKYIDIVNNDLTIIGVFLIINGIMLFIISNIKNNKQRNKVNLTDSIIVGFFETLGIFPGISRSGSCLSGLFIRKVEKEEACNYAFLLFIPAVFGALLIKLKDVGKVFYNNELNINYFISFISSFVFTYLGFVFLLKIIRKGKIDIFGFYTIILGLIVLLMNS